jgi:hypothetical protein
MATVTKSSANKLQRFGGVPFGNHVIYQYNLTTNASGVAVPSDQSTALQIGDVVRLGLIPAGTTLVDFTAVISDAFTAATTAGVGFAYADGVDSTDVPQNAAYFVAAAGLALNATGTARKTTVTAPVTLPKDAYLTLTLAGAAHASVGIVDIAVDGVMTGV